MENKSKKKSSKMPSVFIWTVFGMLLIVGFAYATTTITDTSIVVNGSNVAKSSSFVIGPDGPVDYNPVGQNIASVLNTSMASLSSNKLGGDVILKQGNYTTNVRPSLQEATFDGSRGRIWIHGTGAGTVITKNTTGAYGFAVGGNPVPGDDLPVLTDVRFSDFSFRGISHQSGVSSNSGFVVGNPTNRSNFNKRVTIDNLYLSAMDARAIAIDADDLRVHNNVFEDSLGAYGGEGTRQWFQSNTIINNIDNSVYDEVEGIDANSPSFADLGFHTWITDNYIEKMTEQGIDVSNFHAHISGNTVVMPKNATQLQSGITDANGRGIVTDNIILNVSLYGYGGIESGINSKNGIISNNYIHKDNDSVSSVGCLSIRGNDTLLIGNQFDDCNTPFGSNSATNLRTQAWGNWFEPAAVVAESEFIGANYLNGSIKLQGADTNITRQLIVTNRTITPLIQLTANASAVTCVSATAGMIYYDGSLVKHYGCNGTNWNALY